MNRKVRNLLASVVLGVCLLTLSFIPSFAANSANSVSVGNVEAMKENVVYDFQSLSFTDAPDYVKGIKSVSVNKTKWEEAQPDNKNEQNVVGNKRYVSWKRETGSKN